MHYLDLVICETRDLNEPCKINAPKIADHPDLRSGGNEECTFHCIWSEEFDFSTKEKFEAGVEFVQLEDIGIGICRYGAATTVGFSEGDSVRLQIALNGRAETTIDGKHYAIDGPTGCVIPSGQPLQASFSERYEQLLGRIKTDALERNLTAILGARPKDRLEFSPAIDLSGAYAGG